MDARVTGRERRLVRRYYVMPALARRGFGYILLVMGVWLFLSMLDDLVFHDPGLYLVGLGTMLAIVVALTVAICYTILSSRFELSKKTWGSVAAKARSAQREGKGEGDATEAAAGDDDDLDDSRRRARIRRRAIQTPLDAREDLGGLMRAAQRVALPLGIPLPDPRRFCHLVLAGALALLAVAYVPHYLVRVQTMREQTQAAAQTTRALEASFADAGLDPFGIDPTEGHKEVSYYVTADVTDAAGEPTGSDVRVDVDNEGRVIEVDYSLAVDPTLSLEESLARAEKDLALLHGAVVDADVPALAPGLVSAGELFPAFRDAFLAGSPYEGIMLDHYDVGDQAVRDGAEVTCGYITDPQDEWDEYSEAYVIVLVEPER